MTMVMDRLSKSQFKPRALEFFRDIESSGKPLVITDNGIPVLEIRPWRPKTDQLEQLRGSILHFTPPET
jgi:antitoxin (DNA-binding transcriptional repressor) of toxin-antitoxin stability system